MAFEVFFAFMVSACYQAFLLKAQSELSCTACMFMTKGITSWLFIIHSMDENQPVSG
jgi:hypothetical protein